MGRLPTPRTLPRPIPFRLHQAAWWAAYLSLAALGSAFSLALLTWALDRPGGDFWPRVSAYWLSRHALPFWISALALETAGAWLAAPLAWPPGRRHLLAAPAGCFLAGVACSALRFLRQSLGGTPFWGQVAAFWPDAVALGLSLAAGAFLALLALGWVSAGGGARPAVRGGRRGRDSGRPRRT